MDGGKVPAGGSRLYPGTVGPTGSTQPDARTLRARPLTVAAKTDATFIQEAQNPNSGRRSMEALSSGTACTQLPPCREHADGGHRHHDAGEPAQGRQPWRQCELPHHLAARPHDHHHVRRRRHPVDHGAPE